MASKSYTCKIELTTSSEDWEIIRECYVQSFRRYPLYKYMVADETKRDDFLRAYLDANYEVTVGSGQGILLAVKAHELDENGDEVLESDLKVVGGVVFVPPASDGCGWAIADDEPYFKAYEKYNLASISEDGLRRVKRYEAWENKHVGEKFSNVRIPVWNGFFCALAPEYTSKGLGTAVYKHAIKIMADYWIKQQNKMSNLNNSPRKEFRDSKKDPQLEKLVRRLSLQQLCSFTLINHHPLPSHKMLKKQLPCHGDVSTELPCKPKQLTPIDMLGNQSAPLVVAVTHCDRAANFHKSNGFHPVARIPYVDQENGNTPFFTYILVLDPFKTGRINEFRSALQPTINENNNYSKLQHIELNRDHRLSAIE